MRASNSSTPFVRVRPPGLVAFVGLVSALGLAVIAQSVHAVSTAPPAWNWLLIGVAAIVTGSFALKVPGMPIYFSIADTFFITSAVLFGPGAATVTIAIDSLLVSWRRRNAVDQLLFNTATSAIAIWTAAHVFGSVERSGSQIDVLASPEARTMAAMACLAAVYFVINSGLVATAVALQKQVPLLETWKQYFLVIGVSHFAAASGSFFFIVLLRHVSPFVVAGLAPLVAIFYVAVHSWLARLEDAQRHVETVNRLYLSTTTALATAIEAKDGVTSNHVHRVQAYAQALAHALNISDATDLKAIQTAALLHDVGKLAIPENILNKPGRLTAEEYEVMKTHVDVGADILAAIDFPYPVVPIVRAHHERWDGGGYPAGLRGEEIPIGARILSVVDCFDALTSDRPYRPATGDAEALAIIVKLRGTVYDPEVVDAFVRVCPTVAIAEPWAPLQHAVGRIRQARANASPLALVRKAEVGRPASGFESLVRLVLGSATLADVGALAWDQIRPVAAGASMALFTVDKRFPALVTAYADGPASASLSGLIIALGDRISGWAATHRQILANSDARLDLRHLVSNDLHFAVAVPLVAENKLMGVLTLYGPHTMSDEVVGMLEGIAPHLAVLMAASDTDDRPTPSSRPREAAFSSRRRRRHLPPPTERAIAEAESA